MRCTLDELIKTRLDARGLLNLARMQGSLPEIKGLTEKIAKAISVTAVNLSHNELSESAVKPIIEMILSMPTLKGIYLSNNSFTAANLAAICEAATCHPMLKSLDLSGHLFNPSGTAALTRLIRDNTTLTHLNLNAATTLEPLALNKSPDTAAVMQALQQNTTLTQLQLDNTYLEATTFTAAAKMLQVTTSLKTFSMCYTGHHKRFPISPVGFINFLQALERNTSIEALKIGGIELTPGSMQEMKALFRYIKGSNLRTDALGEILIGQGIAHPTTRELGYTMASVVAQHKSLKSFGLCNSILGNIEASQIINLGLSNPNITYLDLSLNQINSFDDVTVNNLRKNTSLSILKLSGNKLSDANPFLKLVVHNSSLRELDISSNNIDPSGANRLMQTCFKRGWLSSLDLQGIYGMKFMEQVVQEDYEVVTRYTQTLLPVICSNNMLCKLKLSTQLGTEALKLQHELQQRMISLQEFNQHISSMACCMDVMDQELAPIVETLATQAKDAFRHLKSDPKPVTLNLKTVTKVWRKLQATLLYPYFDDYQKGDAQTYMDKLTAYYTQYFFQLYTVAKAPLILPPEIQALVVPPPDIAYKTMLRDTASHFSECQK